MVTAEVYDILGVSPYHNSIVWVWSLVFLLYGCEILAKEFRQILFIFKSVSELVATATATATATTVAKDVAKNCYTSTHDDAAI